MTNSLLARRALLNSSLAYVATALALRPAALAATVLAPTPAQTAGPFYPQSFPQDADNDLVHVAGHQGAAKGTITHIRGRILDTNGRAFLDARVEIWQCDANGRYHYVRDNRTDQPRDEDFQGYGATMTRADGGYEFLTIKPVPYPGRTPHIHFAVSGRGFERLITQMYVAGEAGNERDPVLLAVNDPPARARLIVPLQSSPDGLAGTFDIVIGGRS